MEPTDDQLEGFGSLRDIVMYVRGRVPEEIETLVVAMGASLDSAPTLLSRISDTEIEGAMSLVPELPILVKSVVRQMLHICRLKGNCVARPGAVPAMEADRPWKWVFGEISLGSQFWHLEVEEPSLLLLNRTRSLGDLLTGEAPVGDAGKRQAAGKTGEEPRFKKPKG